MNAGGSRAGSGVAVATTGIETSDWEPGAGAGGDGGNDRLLTTADVAEFLGTSERTVSRLVERGELPEIRVTKGLRRFASGDVEAFVVAKRERKRSHPTPPPAPRSLARRGRDTRRFTDRLHEAGR